MTSTTLKNLASQCILAAIESEELSREEVDFFSDMPVAGVTLFGRNISNEYFSTQLANLIAECDGYLSRDLRAIVAIDQEGGRVRRLREPFYNPGPALEWPSDQEACFEIGYKTASALTSFGINTNFAPLADIYHPDGDKAIGDRCLSDNIETIHSKATGFIEGQTSANVLSCLKHFPGQGSAKADTHHQTATIDKSKSELYDNEIKSFAKLLSISPMVMSSHAIFSALDANPASLSRPIIHDLLRGELRYRGLVVSDDMMMHAISQDSNQWCKSLIQAIYAGTDLLLICRGLDRCKLAIEALANQADQDVSFKNRLEDAAMRVRMTRKQLQ